MLTDISRSLLMACIIFWIWLRQTSKMVSCAAHAEIARIRRIAPLQKLFTAIFSLMVSYLITFVGPTIEKRGYNGRQ